MPRLIARLRSNALAAWPKRAYEQMFLHRRTLGRDSYLINDPDEALRIFRSDTRIYERPLGFRRLFRPIVGGGLLLAEGTEWREQRQRIAPVFNGRHVEKLIPRFRSVGERLLHRLDGAAKANFSQLFDDVSIDAIGTAAFSMDLNSLTQRIGNFRTNYMRCARASLLDHLARKERDFLLGWGPRGRHGRRGRAIVREIIRDRRSGAGHNLGSQDFLDLMLAARRDGEALSDDDICDEVATILGTGFDTPGRVMFWTVYLLSLDRGAQERVRQELRLFPPNRVRQLSDLDRWPFLHKCIWESLRLYPPLQAMIRVPRVPVEICGRAIKPGSYVTVSPWVMHRHESLWDEPNAFLPNRFPESSSASMRMRGFIPFGIGNRICVGASFAMTEIALILAMLLERHEILLDDDRPILPVSVVTTVPSAEPVFRVRPMLRATM
ncbi:cytochrome P450 [Sphingomonas sp. RT2P30]|uniref:cytochrome P450 n=1 Tax=Parasphingomonas halimpatiens TaxID=3096162 RepID=UPI002FCA2AF6